MKIRAAIEQDIPTIASLLLETQQAHTAAYPERFCPMSLDKANKIVATRFADKNGIYRVAEHASDIHGYLYAVFRSLPATDFTFERKYCYVCEIAVSERERRRGVGSALIQSVCEIAKTNGYDRIELDVWAFNDKGLAFFEGNGLLPLIRKLYLHL